MLTKNLDDKRRKKSYYKLSMFSILITFREYYQAEKESFPTITMISFGNAYILCHCNAYILIFCATVMLIFLYSLPL